MKPRRGVVRRSVAPAPLLTVVLAGLLSGLLAGCVSIPASGPVVTGRTIDEGARPPRVKFFALPPSPGDSPVAIAEGFLRAAADFSANHSVARRFLSPDKATTWRPDNQVVIYSADAGGPTIRQTEAFASRSPSAPPPSPGPSPLSSPTSASVTSPTSSPTSSPQAAASPGSSPKGSGVPTPSPEAGARVTVAVEISVEARIRGKGVYLPAGPDEVQLLSYQLVTVDGQWRITNPEDGVVISRPDFEATFSDVPLYFRDRTGQFLVPDVRWFPVTSTPSVVVSALLDGPVNWLNAAVTTGAPSGTALTATGVRNDQGVVGIDLTNRALDASPEQRQVLLAQLRATLDAAARTLEFPAFDVQLTVEQARFEVPVSGSAPLRRAEEIEVDPRPVALDAQSRLNRLIAARASVVDDLAALPGGVSHPGVSLGGTSYAVLSSGQSSLVTLASGVEAQVRVRAPTLSPPSFDVHDWVWTSPRANAGVVYAVRAAGASAGGGGDGRVEVAAPWLRGFQVSALRVSRDGARALVVATHEGRGQAFVCGVVREDDGTPTVLTDPPLRMLRDLTAARDGSWLGDERVSILGSRPGTAVQTVWRVQVGGEVSARLAAPDVLSVTTDAEPAELWAQTSDGAAYQFGAGLLKIPGLRWPAVPG